MQIRMLKSKIHRATVTMSNLNYVGSITIDANLLDAANILEYEAVQVVNVSSGNRFMTYTIAGERGSGEICLNGAAARLAQTGDKIIIMAYAEMTPEEAQSHQPTVVLVDAKNAIEKVCHYETRGTLIEDAKSC